MKQGSLGTIVVLLICAWVLIVFVIGCVNKCFTQDDTALRLVQCIRAECDSRDNPEEHAAIAWALWKQSIDRGVPFRTQIVRYCAYANRHNDRARKIWNSTFKHPLWGHKNMKKRMQRWSRMKQWSTDFLDGKIPDPLDDSVKYFGGEMDPKKPGCVEVKRYCNRHGQRCNIFYKCR